MTRTSILQAGMEPHLGLHPVHGDQLKEHQPDDVEGQVDLRGRVVPEHVRLEDLLRGQEQSRYQPSDVKMRPWTSNQHPGAAVSELSANVLFHGPCHRREGEDVAAFAAPDASLICLMASSGLPDLGETCIPLGPAPSPRAARGAPCSSARQCVQAGCRKQAGAGRTLWSP